MTQYHSDTFGRRRDVAIRVAPQRAKLAAPSAVCGSMFFVPLAPLAGIVLALLAIRDLRSRAGRTGWALAEWGLAIGVLFTALQGFVAFKTIELAETVEHGPTEALAAGFAGETGEFVGWFDGADADEASSFITTLRERYGSFRGGDAEHRVWDWRPGESFEYRLGFESGTVSARAEIALAASPMGRPAMLRSIVLEDPELGNVRFPGAQKMASGD